MTLVDLVRLVNLKEGLARREISIPSIGGPLVLGHLDLTGSTVLEVPGKLKGACTRVESIACTHGTFVAGVHSARRGSVAPERPVPLWRC